MLPVDRDNSRPSPQSRRARRCWGGAGVNVCGARCASPSEDCGSRSFELDIPLLLELEQLSNPARLASSSHSAAPGALQDCGENG